jgi:ABC-2 type transport system ATP-binding protein
VRALNAEAAPNPAPPAGLSRGDALVLRGLVKRYPGQTEPAVDGIDLTVHRGEVFGLLGPNGAGKTTTVSILCTLLRPTAGEVTLCGEDLVRHPRRVRPKLGWVPQEIALYRNLTARENLAYFGALQGLGGKKLSARVSEGLEAVGLTSRADDRIYTYSGGMRRRANLAAALLHEPELLLLDEPTVGIDAQSRHLILSHLSELAARGMTMIYTTHYMEEAATLCNRVAVIDKGKIVAVGEPAALVAAHPPCADLEELFLQLTGNRLRD